MRVNSSDIAGVTSGISPGIVNIVDEFAAKTHCRRVDCAGMTVERAIGPNFRAETPRNFGGSRVHRDDCDSSQLGHGCNRFQHVLEHGERQILRRTLATALPPAVVWRGCFLDRHNGPNVATRARQSFVIEQLSHQKGGP